MVDVATTCLRELKCVGAIDPGHGDSVATAGLGLATVEYKWPGQIYTNPGPEAEPGDGKRISLRARVRLVQATRDLVLGARAFRIYDSTYKPSIAVRRMPHIVFNHEVFCVDFFESRDRGQAVGR